jgi:RNA polymerase sigma-70 factor (ECF subfamily)
MTEAEFRDAFHQHKDVLFRIAYRMTGSVETAEDVVQDCFMTLWRKPEAYQPERGALRPFLLGIARNLILKRWRDDRLQEVLEDEVLICAPLDPIEGERGDAVARAVARLPLLQREVLVLAGYEEMPLEQIAQTTGAGLAAVKSRLHRARQNLRRMLAPLLESKGVSYGTER